MVLNAGLKSLNSSLTYVSAIEYGILLTYSSVCMF